MLIFDQPATDTNRDTAWRDEHEQPGQQGGIDQHGRPPSAAGMRIINDCRQQLGDALCRWLTGIRATISEELFLLADGTRDRLLRPATSICAGYRTQMEHLRRRLPATALRTP